MAADIAAMKRRATLQPRTFKNVETVQVETTEYVPPKQVRSKKPTTDQVPQMQAQDSV